MADHGPVVVSALAMQNALGRLADRQRCALVLRFYADLSVAEIAAAMGCAEGTVKATLHQALQRLRVDAEELIDAD